MSRNVGLDSMQRLRGTSYALQAGNGCEDAELCGLHTNPIDGIINHDPSIWLDHFTRYLDRVILGGSVPGKKDVVPTWISMKTARRTFCETHGMTIPVVQAPMAGGPTTPELVAAVCNAGGLGSLGAEYLAPSQIEQAIEKIRGLTPRPFAVNLFSPDADQAPAGELAAVAEFLNRYHERLGIGPPELPASGDEDFHEQIEVLYRLRVPIVSFTLGTLPIEIVERLKGQSTYVIGTATTVEEALVLERVGVDAVTAQGSDAGGHRGTFLAEAESALVGTMALVPQIVDAVSVPVLASGGIMDGRGIVAALALGASAAQMGTAFLVSDEAGTNKAARRALLDANEDQTTITRAFSGRPARGLRNEFIEEWNKSGLKPMSFPLQNVLTRPMRRAAAARNEAGLQSVWAGQGLRLLRQGSAASIMLQLQKEIANVTATTLEKVLENLDHGAPTNDIEGNA